MVEAIGISDDGADDGTIPDVVDGAVTPRAPLAGVGDARPGDDGGDGVRSSWRSRGAVSSSSCSRPCFKLGLMVSICWLTTPWVALSPWPTLGHSCGAPCVGARDMFL